MILKLNFFSRSLSALFLGPRAAFALVRVPSILLVGIAILFASTAFAGTINYPGPDDGPDGPGGMSGWMGDTVWYAGVSESNSDTEMRFGAPSGVTGDAIDFNPVNFQAESSGGGSEIVDSQLSFMVVALADNVIDSLALSEAGDTTIFAFPPDLAFTSVTADIFIDVIQIDGVTIGAPLNITGSMTFTPSDGTYLTGDDGSPNYNTIWSGSANFDFEAELTALGYEKGIDYTNGATKINVTLDNTLTAGTSGTSASAFIKKKDFDGLTVTTNVPEPTTLVLAALGLVSVISTRRRRNS